MNLVDYTDERGRKYRVELPEGMGQEDAHLGIPIGPPDVVDFLDLPEDIATRLHNNLFDRGLWDLKSLRKNMSGLQGAIMSALRLDSQKLHQAYVEYEKEPVSNGQ